MGPVTATLEKKELLRDDILVLSFRLSQNASFAFNPGQYIWLILPNLVAADPAGNRRAFSLTSSIQDLPVIQVLIKMSNSGYKQTCKQLEVGAEVSVEGPFGSAFSIDSQKSDRRHVMIAGGCGISPFLSVMRSELTLPNSLYHLITISKSAELACMGEEVVKVATEKQIVHTPVFGHFTPEHLPSSIDYQRDEFYVCGSQQLVDAVAAGLQSKGVQRHQVHYEQFYPTIPYSLTEEQFSLSLTSENILFQAVLDSRNHVIVTDANGKIIFANPKAEEHTGYTFAEMRGNTPRLWGGLMSPDLYAQIWQDCGRDSGFDGELVNRRKNGEMYHVIAHISPIFDKENRIIGYIGTEEDITDRVKLERAKEEFVSIASHQLRTPLGIVRWYIEALKEEAGYTQGSEKFQSYINQIQKNNERLQALVQDLLSVSRIDQGKVRDEVSEVDIVALVKDLFEEMHILAVQHKIDYQLQIPTAIPQLKLDAKRLREAFGNLIANAFEFTPDQGKITVTLEANDQQVLFSVKDSGIGISPADQAKLFQKFVRLERATKVSPDGTGLGLFVAKSYVDAWGGSISINSQEGQGATFTVALPIQKGGTQ